MVDKLGIVFHVNLTTEASLGCVSKTKQYKVIQWQNSNLPIDTLSVFCYYLL